MIKTELKKNESNRRTDSKAQRETESRTDLQTQVSFLKYTLCGK